MEVFDRRAALERAGGDTERLGDRLEDFQIQLPARMSAMAKAAGAGRTERLLELARDLHEAAYGIAADGMVELASQIERAASASELDSVETLLTHMEMEFEWLARILDENRCSGNL